MGEYQDYLWFLSGLCWLVAALSWWRLSSKNQNWSWLPWSAAAGLVISTIEVGCSMTVPSFRPRTPPLLVADTILGIAAGLQAAGWMLSALRVRRSAKSVFIIILVTTVTAVTAGARPYWPVLAGWSLMILTLVAGIYHVMRLRPTGLSRLALALATLCIPLSNWGPLAGTWIGSLRWGDVAGHGTLAAALLHLLTAGLALYALLRTALQSYIGKAVDDTVRREAIIFAVILGLWLVCGLALAFVSGRIARDEFEKAAVSRVAMGSVLLDVDKLTECLGPNFKLDRFAEFKQLQGAQTPYAISDWLKLERTRPLEETLSRLSTVNADVDDIFVVTLKGGWLVGALFARRTSVTEGGVSLERAMVPSDLEAWEQRRPLLQHLEANAYGGAFQAWAPLSSAKGEMLGWLVFEYSPSRWLIPQGQSRLQTFAVVALGVFFCALLFLHRTTTRQREAAALAAAGMAAANRLKTTFLATVSHELRTPLQAIRGYCEMLEKQSRGAATWPLFTTMQAQIDVMQRLVGDLLDLSAMEAGAFQCIRQSVDVRRIVEDLDQEFRRQAESKGLAFHTQLSGKLPPWLEGDGVRLRQLLSNLLSNAVKYTESGEIGFHLVAEAVMEQWAELTFTVEDTGPGIPPESRSALFQPFSRLDVSTSKEGSGLGLALASGLAKSLGGGLFLEQSGPEGSRFVARVRWPLASVVTAPRQDQLAAYTSTPGTVLILEDNGLIQALFADYLRSCGAICDQVSNGTQALAALKTGRYKAAVLDLSVPGLDGCEVARQVRALPSLAHTLRLVGVSAHAGEEDKRRALAAGMDQFLVKPVELKALAAALGFSDSVLDKTTVPQALLQKLRDQFRGEAPLQLAEIEAAMVAADWPSVARLAHHLSNSAFALQADALGEKCRAFERAAAAADTPAAFRAWAAVQAALKPWVGPKPIPADNRDLSSSDI